MATRAIPSVRYSEQTMKEASIRGVYTRSPGTKSPKPILQAEIELYAIRT